MNRKKLVSLSILLLLLIFTTCIVISPVSAAKESTWEKVFGSMEGVVGGFFQRVSDNPATWLKVMILIALFAVMYFGALKIGLPRNIAGVVAMVIALIGTVGIPGDALIYLMKLYGGIATTIMIVGPAVGLGWITWKVTREADNRWINLVFAVIWGLFLGLVMAFSETIQNIDVGAELEALSGTIAVITLISLIIIVILIILFFTEKGREVGGAIGEKSKKTLKSITRTSKRGLVLEKKAISLLRKAKDYVNKGNAVDAIKCLRKAEKEILIEEKLDKVLITMEDRLEELEGPHAEKLKAELETIKKDQQAELIEHYEAVGTGIERALDKLEDDEKLDLDGAKRAIDTSIEYERKALAILRVVTRLGKKIKKLL